MALAELGSNPGLEGFRQLD